MLYRPLGWLAAAATVLALGVFAAPGALATDGTDEDDPGEPETSVLVRIAPTETIVGLLDTVQLRVQVSNVSEEDLGRGYLDVVLSTDPVEHADEVILGTVMPEADAADEPEGAPLTWLGTVEIPEIAAGESYETTFDPEESDVPLDFTTDPGIFMIGARYESATPSRIAHWVRERTVLSNTHYDATTPLLWRAADFHTVTPVAPVIPLVFPGSSDTPLTPDQLAGLAGDGSRVDRLLTAAETYDLTVAVDPKILATVRAFGAEAPESAREIVERITSDTLTTAALQYADADPAVQSALGLDEPLQPTGFSHLTRFFEPLPESPETDEPLSDGPNDVVFDVPDRFAKEQADPGSETEDAEEPEDLDNRDQQDRVTPETPPTATELLDWQPTLEGFAWPAREGLTPDSLVSLNQNGFQSVLVSEESASGPAAATLGDLTTYVSDDTLGNYVSELFTAESVTDEEYSRAMIAALTALRTPAATDAEADDSAADDEEEQDDRAGQEPIRGDTLILALDRNVILDAPEPEQLFDFLFDLPWVESAPLPEPGDETIVFHEPTTDEDRLDALATAVEGEGAVREFSRVLVEPQHLIDFQRDRLLSYLAVRHAEDAEAFELATETYREVDETLASGIAVVDTEHTRLLGTSSLVPVQLRNRLPFDAIVAGRVTATSAALTVDEPLFDEVVIDAEGSVNHLVPVGARVSNGESGLYVQLQDTREGEAIASRELEIIIQSDIEFIALGTLASLAVVLLGFGTVRSIRRHRTKPVTEQAESGS